VANDKTVQSLVSELMSRNKIGDQFSHDVPPDWPIEAWRLLLGEKSDQWDTESLHFWLAHHVYAPDEIVRILAASPSRRVRWRIAQKRNLPLDLFEMLATDHDEGIRRSVAENKKAPRDVIEMLRADPSESVRRLAESRLAPKSPLV
jgi:hypothetical protein